MTDAPDRRKSRLNAVQTRTSPSVEQLTFDSQQPPVEGGGASLQLAQPPTETSNRESPAHAAITPRGSPPDHVETRTFSGHFIGQALRDNRRDAAPGRPL